MLIYNNKKYIFYEYYSLNFIIFVKNSKIILIIYIVPRKGVDAG